MSSLYNSQSSDVQAWNLRRTLCRNLFSRKSSGVHDCRRQLRSPLEQLNVMFCRRSLRIFSTEAGGTVAVTITSPTNLNMTTPQIGVFTIIFFLCINVSLLVFVSGCVWQCGLRKWFSRPLSVWAIAHLFDRKYAQRFLFWGFWSGHTASDVVLPRWTTAQEVKFVFIVEDGTMCRNMKHCKHVRGVLWGHLCSIVSGLWFHICRSTDNARLAEPCSFLFCFLFIVCSNVGELSETDMDMNRPPWAWCGRCKMTVEQ